MPIAQIKQIAELYHQGPATKNDRIEILKLHQQNLMQQSTLIEEALNKIIPLTNSDYIAYINKAVKLTL